MIGAIGTNVITLDRENGRTSTIAAKGQLAGAKAVEIGACCKTVGLARRDSSSNTGKAVRLSHRVVTRMQGLESTMAHGNSGW